MIKKFEKRICDVCKKEVKEFAGSLVLKYDNVDYTGCGCPMKLERDEICVDCCRKLAKALTETLQEMSK